MPSSRKHFHFLAVRHAALTCTKQEAACIEIEKAGKRQRAQAFHDSKASIRWCFYRRLALVVVAPVEPEDLVSANFRAQGKPILAKELQEVLS